MSVTRRSSVLSSPEGQNIGDSGTWNTYESFVMTSPRPETLPRLISRHSPLACPSVELRRIVVDLALPTDSRPTFDRRSDII